MPAAVEQWRIGGAEPSPGWSGGRGAAGAAGSGASRDPSLGKGGIGFLPPRPRRTNSSG